MIINKILFTIYTYLYSLYSTIHIYLFISLFFFSFPKLTEITVQSDPYTTEYLQYKLSYSGNCIIKKRGDKL